MKTRTINASNVVGIEETNAINAAYAVQDACNMVAIVGAWHRHLLALSHAGLGTDAICRHPSTILIVSKLVSLSRFSHDYVSEPESQAFDAYHALRDTGRVEWSY